VQNANFSFKALLTILFNNISNSFVDFWFVYTFFPDLNLPRIPLGVFIKPLLFLLIAYSIYFLCRNTKQKTYLFVLVLIGITPAVLISRDLITGSGVSTQARYLIPCFLGIQISIAYLFANKISNVFLSFWQKKIWQAIAILLISAGILSCAVSSQAESWANKYHSKEHQIAAAIERNPKTLIISDSSPVAILSLSHELDRNVQFQLVTEPQKVRVSTDFDRVFLYEPSQELKQAVKNDTNSHIVSVKNADGLLEVKL
jgi:uncharacterized membrane protein